MREREMASVHSLEARSRVSEDRYALGGLKQCMMRSQRHPSRSRIIQREASVNFRSRIPALAAPVCALPPTTSPHLCELKTALCHFLKKTALTFGIFPRERFFPFWFTDADIWVMMNLNTYLPFSHFSFNVHSAHSPSKPSTLPTIFSNGFANELAYTKVRFLKLETVGTWGQIIIC